MKRKILIFLLLSFLLSGCIGEGRVRNPPFTGIHSDSIIHDGLLRTYTYYMPSSYDKNNPSPLFIVLHGGGGKGEDMIRLTGGRLNALADREGAIVVYPDAVDNHWNDGRGLEQYRAQRENVDDVGFMSDLIDNLGEELSIDTARVFAAGISNGGMMVQRLACEMTDKIAGIAVISSAMPENLSLTCAPTRPVSVLIIAGTEDPLIPFEGGVIGFGAQERGTVLSIPKTLEFWVSSNKCSPVPASSWEPDKDPQDGTRVRRDVFGQCGGGTEVILYVIEGGGHTWPGGAQYLPEGIVGKTSRDMDANEVIWDFFSGHSRAGLQSPAEGSPSKSSILSFTVLQDNGGRASWLHSKNLLAFDRMERDGYFDVYIIRPENPDPKCLTCKKEFPLNNGNPSWHPSGEYLVFQAQDPALKLPSGRLNDYFASPGIGINNNLFISNFEGTMFWQVTHVSNEHGTLHPQFSHDGGKLLWSEIANPGGGIGGRWVMRLADFSIENGEPHVSRIQTFSPLNLQLYETHGFSSDGKKILFSAIEEGGFYYDFEIYIMDLETGEANRMTDNDEWDEHAHYTPDGKHIIWVSSEGTPQPKAKSWQDILDNPLLFEYWMMDADGSHERRLSGFNDPFLRDFLDWVGGVGLGDFDFGPDGKKIVAKMRRGKGLEILALIEINIESSFFLFTDMGQIV